MDEIIKDLNKLAISYEVAANKLGKINKEYFDHDCHLSEGDGCKVCEEINEETNMYALRFQKGHGVSNCCGARTEYEIDQHFCTDCKEACDEVEDDN